MRKICLSIAALISCAFSSAAPAAIITGLGLDVDRGQTWRSTDDPKPAAFDPNGDNAYGNDGYYVLGADTITTTPSVFSSLPSYVSTVAQTSGATYGDNSYALLDDPRQPIGPGVANMIETGIAYDATLVSFTITLSQDQDFVMGIILDTDSRNDLYGGETVLVSSGAANATITEPLIDQNKVPDYAFFEVQGSAGEIITIDLTPIGGGARAELSGISFEHVPEPASLSLLGMGSLLMLRRRRA